MTQQPKTDWPDWLTALKQSAKAAPRHLLGIQAGAYLEGHVDGWNDCIDHISQRGILDPEGRVAVLEMEDKEKCDCLFDKIPPEDRYKPMSISCPCKKCTPWSM